MPSRPGERFEVPEDAAHYLRDVLRMRPDDVVEIFDGAGVSWRCSIVTVSPNVSLQADERLERGVESPLSITLYQSIPKGDRWEWILEKATELGVTRIVPVESKRTVVSIPSAKVDRKLERWRRIIDGAARQSTRTVTPEVSAPASFDRALADCDVPHILFCHPGRSVGRSDHDVSSVALWIGPEGGFTDDEVDALRAAGARALGLGPRVLRAETAAIAGVTLLQATWGDLS